MMKYKLLLAAVVGCLCYGCGNEEPMDDNESAKTEIGKDEILLNYSIEELVGQTYAVKPLPNEMEINTVFYIFQDLDGVVLASSYRDDLQDYKEGNLLPIQIPREMKEYTEEMQVRIICNWDAYLAKGTSINVLHENLKGKKQSYIDELTSLGIDVAPPDFAANTRLLYTGTFNYRIGTNVASVQLHRKNVIFDVTVDMSANFEPKKLTVGNLPCATYLFQEKAIVPGDRSRQYDVNLVANKKVRVYALPNTKENVIKMSLLTTRDAPTSMNMTNDLIVGGGVIDAYEPPLRTDTTIHINLAVENTSSTFFSNQYIQVNLFSTVGKEQQQELSYTVGSWLGGKFEGTYLRDQYGNGMAVTPTNLEFDFVDSTPLRTWTATTASPTGKATREIFVSVHGLPSAWNIRATDIPDWLTIERSEKRSSILVSVEPNFTVTTDGRIHTAVRRFKFNVSFDGSAEIIPVVITQKEGPSTPSDVKIGVADDKPGDGNKREIWLRDRYEQVDKGNSAVTNNFFANTDDTEAGGVGDWYGRERVRQTGSRFGNYKYGYVKNSFASLSNYPSDENLQDPAGPRDEAASGAYSIYTKCNHPTIKYKMIRIDELAMLLFPRLRRREIWLDGHAALMYYVTDGTNLSFINMTGMGFDDLTYFSPSTRIYADARGSKWRYNKYPSDYAKDPNYEKNAAGAIIRDTYTANLFCYYGMELGYTQRALTSLVDGGGATRNVLNGMLRCVERKPISSTKNNNQP